MVKFILIFLLFIFQFSSIAVADITPLTFGDLEQYMKLSKAQKTKYIYNFYKKNKEAGATDGEILNEILKIDEINSDPIIGYFSDISKKVQDFETYAQYAVAEINKQIESEYPNQPEKFVDIDNKDTWKNIKYIVPKVNPTTKYFESIIQKKCFSKPTYINGAALLVASCAVKNKEQNKLLSGIMVLLDDDYSVLFKKNGETEHNIKIDIVQSSKNIEISKYYYPLPEQNSEGDLIYKKEMILPFEINILDREQPINLNISLNLPLCFNNKCQNITFQNTSLQIEQSPVHSEACIQLEQAKYTSLNNQGTDFKLNEIFIYPDKKNIELSISKNFFSKNPNIFIFGNKIITGKPSISTDGNNSIYKFPVINFDQILENEFDIDVFVQQNRDGYQMHQKIKTKTQRTHFYSLSFKNVSLFIIYFSILFLFTPFSLGALTFIYKVIHCKNNDEFEDFFNSYIKSFSYSFLFIVGILYISHYSKIFWGLQFHSPLLNYCFLSVILYILTSYKKFMNNNSSSKQGFFIGVLTIFLPIYSPLISTQYHFYSILKQSPIFFISMIYVLHFSIMSCLFFTTSRIKFMDKYHIFFNKIVYFPIIFQSVLLLILIFTQTTLIQFSICVLGSGFFFIFSKKITVRYFVILLLISSFFLPIHLNKKVEIDVDQIITDEITSGKKVLISTDDASCVFCKIRQGIVSFVLNRKKASQIKSIYIPYNHKWFRSIVGNTTDDVLPVSFLYTEKNNILLPNFIFPWTLEYLLTHSY